MCWDFPGGPVVKTPPFNAENLDSITDRGNKIPHAKWHGQMKKKLTWKIICNLSFYNKYLDPLWETAEFELWGKLPQIYETLLCELLFQ